MKLSRLSRFFAACIALLSMLFMQLAVAGYACPGLNINLVSKSVSMSAMSTEAGSMPGCTGTDADADAEQPSLCHAQTQVGKLSLDRPAHPAVQPFIPVALPLAFDASPPAYGPVALPPDSFLLTRITAPPLSIRNCCFQI